MGFLLSKFSNIWSFFEDEPCQAVMLGLDAAGKYSFVILYIIYLVNITYFNLICLGKTTVLYKLKLNETITTIPTLGFNVETVTPCKGLSLTIWDVGGQDILRNLWHHYFNKSDGMC